MLWILRGSPYAAKEYCLLYYNECNYSQKQFNLGSELPMIVQTTIYKHDQRPVDSVVNQKKQDAGGVLSLETRWFEDLRYFMVKGYCPRQQKQVLERVGD